MSYWHTGVQNGGENLGCSDVADVTTTPPP